jgi:hypothetical protein
MKTSAILHQEDVPNWAALRTEVPEVAAKRLQGILARLDASEKQIFALRGMAALLIEERQLYRFVVDEEAGDYFQSFDKFLKDVCPNSWSYVRDALRAVKELKDVPFEDLLQMKRCNIQQLKQTSSSVRVLPEVIEAAKKLPEKELVAKLNTEHDQHLETAAPVVMAPKEDVEEFETAVEMVTLIDDCHSRAEAIKAIGIRIIQECAAEYEHLKAREKQA